MIRSKKELTRRARLAFWIFRLCFRKRKPDNNGLYWPIQLLQFIKDSNIRKMPIEYIAWFADVVCITHVNNGAADIGEQILQSAGVLFEEINTTGLGNLAYVATRHKDAKIRTRAKELLEYTFSA